MENVIKFRINKTLTASEEKGMLDFVSEIDKGYEGDMVAIDDIFYVEYHFTTTWKHYHEILELVKEKSAGRSYLIPIE